MLYSKPADKSYVEMCIEFDNEFYSGKRDDNKLYQYMYLIYYMLACKKNYFHKFEDYDEYAQFSATTVYMRYLKKEKQGEKIKSILNYAKSTLYPLKIMYQNENFVNIINPSLNKEINSIDLQQNLRNSVQNDYNYGLEEEIIEILNSLPKLIKQVLNETPYTSNKLMYKRLYISCLLTLINSLTLSNQDKYKCDKKMKLNSLTDDYILNLLSKEREHCPIIWKIDESMLDYVRILVNKVRALINDKIIQTKELFELSDDVLDSILASATYTDKNFQGDWNND